MLVAAKTVWCQQMKQVKDQKETRMRRRGMMLSGRRSGSRNRAACRPMACAALQSLEHVQDCSEEKFAMLVFHRRILVSLSDLRQR